ncbi:MAG: ornithine carbamoyltransferase [Spirochaetota bacterium]
MDKHLISIDELSAEEIKKIINTAANIAQHPETYAHSLEGRTLLLLFQKTSTRTRIAFEAGMKRLGGHTVVLDWDRSNFSISPIRYESLCISKMAQCLMARLIKNTDLVELARWADIPVINGCCDSFHPTQVLADLMTIWQIKKSLDTCVAYVGVQNNVANSLFYACKKLGLGLIFATPVKDTFSASVCLDASGWEGFESTLDLEYAAERAEFIYTDAWINMEKFNSIHYQEEKQKRIDTLLPYQVNKNLISNYDVYVMHDMPVHPGYEIDEFAINCDKSVILKQAENRLYTAQALLLFLLEGL